MVFIAPPYSGATGYRSTDGGDTFLPVNAPFEVSYTPDSLQYTASPDRSMYAFDLCDPRYTPDFGGIYKSGDGGVTWSLLGGGAPSLVGGFALSADNPALLYASDCHNVYKSSNAGGEWATVATGAGVCQLAADPSNAKKLYGLAYGPGRVMVSSDGGATWNPAGAVVDMNADGLQGIVVSPVDPAEIYLVNASWVGPLTSGFVAKMTNDGKTLTWSTYYGSYTGAAITGAAAAPSGDAWVIGYDQRNDGWGEGGGVPLTADAQGRNTTSAGVFIARIADATASCIFTINPTGQYNYGSPVPLTLTVTAPSGCAWTASSSDAWIHLPRASGAGSGTIPVWLDPNTTAATRTGTVAVNDQIYTVVQAAASCTYQLSSPNVGPGGGVATVAVTAPAGCPWEVQLDNGDLAWLTSPLTGVATAPSASLFRRTTALWISGATPSSGARLEPSLSMACVCSHFLAERV